jgi:hypothetical protein
VTENLLSLSPAMDSAFIKKKKRGCCFNCKRMMYSKEMPSQKELYDLRVEKLDKLRSLA